MPVIKDLMNRIIDKRKTTGAGMYKGLLPGINAAYKMDPNAEIARNLLATGTNTGALTGGTTEGIARILSGGFGGAFNRDVQQKYAAEEADALGKYGQAYQNWRNGGAVGAPPIPGIPEPGPGGQGTPFNPDAVQGTAQALAAPQPSAMLNTPISGANPMAGQQGAGSAPSALPNPFPRAAQATSGGSAPQAGTRQQQPMNAYEDFNSSAYEPLEAGMEQKYGLPSGILKSIRVNGERSNMSAVSPTGARSVYQFVPGTRRRFLKTYGVDAWAGPRQSVEAAALHLRDSLKRNGGDVIGAIKDYRGYAASKDDAYIRRVAAPLGIQYGSGGSTGSPGSTGDISPVAPPEQERVQEAFKPIERPAERPIAERVRSQRLAFADHLMGGGMDPTTAYMFAQPLIEQGVADEQKAAEEEYSAINNRNYMREQMDLSNFGQQQQAEQQRVNAERAETIQFNRDVRKMGLEEAIQARQDRRAHANAMELQAANNAAAEARTRISNAETMKMPVGAQKAYLGNAGSIMKLNDLMGLLGKVPDAFGLRNRALPAELKNRWDNDPTAIQARALLNEFTSMEMHERSGAAVTVEEYARQRGWLPTDDDNADIIQNKLVKIINGISQEQTLYEQAYKGSGFMDNMTAGRGVSPVVKAGAAQASGGGSTDPNRSSW